MLSRTAKIIMRDVGVSVGLLGRKNLSRGSVEQISRFYDRAEAVYTGSPRLWEHERQLITTYLPPPPAKILDVGCGGGRTTACLAEMGHQVTAIDLSEKLIDRATSAFPGIDFRVMDASRLTFADNSFDAAIFSHNGLDCIAPVAVRLKVLNEVLRVVRPGGRFYLSSHNIWGKLTPAHRGLNGWASFGYEWAHRLIRQVIKLNLRAFQGYWWYYDVDGWQLLYSASPRKNLRAFREAGWAPVVVQGRNPDGPVHLIDCQKDMSERRDARALRRLMLSEHHVQYVLEKP